MREHYAALVDKPFFPEIEEYAGPALGWGHCWKSGYLFLADHDGGDQSQGDALPGTIRGDYGRALLIRSGIFNVVHGSDSTESAKRKSPSGLGKNPSLIQVDESEKSSRNSAFCGIMKG
ncbi:nucleoside-diphosphate kinase [Streptococcus sp.]|uniref:nucleoside-diphosphate kinase n=1 Tax=Streptococcus sp. TaxID=1306 RepID=UPI003919399B